ncbi:MAG: MFS transporter, partial [Thermoprotei archaeon]
MCFSKSLMGSGPASKISRLQIRTATLGAMGVFLDGYDLSVIGFGVILASESLSFSPKLHPFLYSLVLTSALIGMAVGGLLFGYLADRLGRKSMFTVDLLLFVVFALLSAASQNVYQLIVFRLLMGIGIGADYPISSSLIAESAPEASRGRLLMYGIMFYWVGTFFAGITNYLTLGLGDVYAWRAALAAGGIIAIPVVLLRNMAPESPRWLILKGLKAEAKRVLDSGIQGVSVSGRYAELSLRSFLRLHWKSLLFVSLAWFGFDVGAYGLGFYTSTLYHEYGVSSLSKIALFGVVTAPFPILAYLVLIGKLDKWGRRLPSLIGFTIMIAVLAILPLALPVNALFLLPLFILFSSMEQWPGGILSFAYSVELFPTAFRARAQGFLTAVSRAGAVTGTLLFLPIASHGLLYGTLFFEAFIVLAFASTFA